MNKLKGSISSIQSSGQLSLVSVDLGNGHIFKSVIIDTPTSAPYLKINSGIIVLFKETEVIVSTDESPKISLQNKLSGSLAKLERGDLLSRLILNTDLGSLVAIISTEAVDLLNLCDGCKLTAMIKLNEVILSPIS